MPTARWSLFLAFALAACATASPELRLGFSPEQRAVLVTVGAPPAEAYRRAVAAFSAEGLSIEAGNAEAGYLTSTPVEVPGIIGSGICHYRATVTAAGSAAEVALVVNYGTPERRMEPVDAEFWRRLQRLAARLRAPAGQH